MLGACASSPRPQHLTAHYVQKHNETDRVRMAVIPVENDSYPKVAAAINEAFKTVRLRAVDDYFRSKVTLDVVQLSIECVDPTSACYTAVGKSLNANVLLMAQISAPPKRSGVRVTITVFNVDTGAPLHSGVRTFRHADEAVAGVNALVTEATGESSGGG
jgi:hypothetical protein